MGQAPPMLLLSWQVAASIDFLPPTTIPQAAVSSPRSGVSTAEGRGTSTLKVRIGLTTFSAEREHSALEGGGGDPKPDTHYPPPLPVAWETYELNARSLVRRTPPPRPLFVLGIFFVRSLQWHTVDWWYFGVTTLLRGGLCLCPARIAPRTSGVAATVLLSPSRPPNLQAKATSRMYYKRGGGGGGGSWIWGEVCVPKVAQLNISLCTFHLFPRGHTGPGRGVA